MFFVLSKILGFLAVPSNLLVEVGLIGLVLTATRLKRIGRWLTAARSEEHTSELQSH